MEEIRKEADEVVGPGTGDIVKYVVYCIIKDLLTRSIRMTKLSAYSDYSERVKYSEDY